jgi:hypothetical protein
VARDHVLRQSPELVEAGLRSRSAGQSAMLLPKTTTEDRVSPRRASAFDAISNVMMGYSVVRHCERLSRKQCLKLLAFSDGARGVR